MSLVNLAKAYFHVAVVAFVVCATAISAETSGVLVPVREFFSFCGGSFPQPLDVIAGVVYIGIGLMTVGIGLSGAYVLRPTR